MRRGLLAAVALVGACWTGAEPSVTEPAAVAKTPTAEPLRLRVKLERTQCFGTCPAYSVMIDGSGRVEWTGHASVGALGRRQGRVSRSDLEHLAKRLDAVQFFERDEYGDMPQKPECQTVGSTTTCALGTSFTICSDTSRAIINASSGTRMNKVDNDHCKERPELDALEDYIDQIANTAAWIKE